VKPGDLVRICEDDRELFISFVRDHPGREPVRVGMMKSLLMSIWGTTWVGTSRCCEKFRGMMVE